MKPGYITDQFLYQFIQQAILEDVGEGDHSTLAAIPKDKLSRAHLLVKETGIIAGVELTGRILHHFDPSLRFDEMIADGRTVTKGDVAFTIEGRAQSILTIERLVLNCMQRMSGIATRTSKLSKLIEGTGVQLVDTRKTTPNFRRLEKWAVVIGGGKNHRLGLYDMVMLKDNHIEIAGGIRQAINRTKDYLRAGKMDLTVEIETRTLAEVNEVLAVGGVDIIMLDNMPVDEMRSAVQMINGRFKTEASGMITEETIMSVAQCGVDYISVGALTHSVKSMDLSLKVY
ncbi:MAG TPA: carboxylating nicotinate-nucleotide diphosphorylase [Cyclobacteriaceae bacterium]|nr:carboxylating nicotinate-nucleotide diphosphorylase [Cyclobacteriaceae bacterium]